MVDRDTERRSVREVKLAADVEDARLLGVSVLYLERAIGNRKRVARPRPVDVPLQKNLRAGIDLTPAPVDEARYPRARRPNPRCWFTTWANAEPGAAWARVGAPRSAARVGFRRPLGRPRSLTLCGMRPATMRSVSMLP